MHTLDLNSIGCLRSVKKRTTGQYVVELPWVVVGHRQGMAYNDPIGVRGRYRKMLLVPEVVATAGNQPDAQQQACDFAPVRL